MTGGEPRRLLVLLHGAGSNPGQVVMAAVAWQLKFRSARAILLAAPHSSDTLADADADADANADAETATGDEVGGDGHQAYRPRPRYWIDPAEYPVQAESVRREAERVAGRIRAWQARTGLGPAQTLLVGFSQGASIALELAFEPHDLAYLIVAFAPRLYRLPVDGDATRAAIHLIHDRYDSVVPLAHGEAALRRLGAISAATSLDVIEDGGHAITQDHLNVATQRAMQTLFASRRERRAGPLH